MGKYDLYLSYSGRKCFLNCPKQYEHRYVLKTPHTRDPRTSFFGSMIGTVFEWFYDRKIWKDENPELKASSLIDGAVSSVLSHEKWPVQEDPDYVNQVKLDLAEYIPKGVKTLRKNKLIAPKVKTELDLTIVYSHPKHDITLKIGGKADFVYYFSKDEIWILDGKGTAHREKYTDPEQVIWYATQHYLKYHIAPSRLGFIYWRFPDDPVQWIDYDSSTIRSSLDLTFFVAKKILNKEFEPTPSNNCYNCDFKKTCSEGTDYLEQCRIENKVVIDTENSIFLL